MEISQSTGFLSPTVSLPAAQRKSSVNGTIGFAELQYIWHKNVMKIVTKCQTMPNVSRLKYSQPASGAYGIVNQIKEKALELATLHLICYIY